MQIKWPEVATFHNFTNTKHHKVGTKFTANTSKRTLMGPVYIERRGDDQEVPLKGGQIHIVVNFQLAMLEWHKKLEQVSNFN